MSYIKPLFYFLIASLIISNACKDKHAEHTVPPLMLNKGKKWKLDDSTRANFAAIRLEIEKAMPGKNYETLFLTIQSKADKMIRDCKMSGPDHDMLHTWLETFLASLKKLKSSSTKMQEEGFIELKESVEIFPKYFE